MMARQRFGFVIGFITVIVLLCFYASTNKQFPLNNAFMPKSMPPSISTTGKEKAAPITEAAAPVTEKPKEPQNNHKDLNFIGFKSITLTEEMTNNAIAQAFQSLVSQIQIGCPDWKMYGRKYNDWAVCRAKAYLPQKPCLVYSFGINYDWSFDELYHKEHGCLVRSFDPSMGGMPEHVHLPNIPFYPLGLSSKKEIHKENGWKMDNLKGFMTRFKDNNKTIHYVKFDIETSEWGVLENLLQDGSLKNVMQLSFEIHVDIAKNYRKYFRLIKGLELMGFRRWHASRRYGRFLYQMDQSYLNINFLNKK